jgi:hypothetical protein
MISSEIFARLMASAALASLLQASLGTAYARNVPQNTTKPADSKIKSLSDEDILNPKKLVFNRVVPFVDSFDKAPLGFIFISKRSILGNPEVGVIGEKGSSNYNRHCLLFCPSGTTEIDASYIYVIEKKGECVLGARGIGWAEKLEEYQGGLLTGRTVEKGRVRHTSTNANIKFILVNGVKVEPPLNKAQLTGPHGTNYKYFPRNRDFLGQQTTANEGYITDIHNFSASKLVQAANSGREVVIDIPNWQPSRHVISGDALVELKKLTSRCDAN